MKLYLVAFDGYTEDYGSYVYAEGIYDRKEKAEEIVKQIKTETNDDISPLIYEIEANKPFEVKKDEYGYYFTEICLGGYAE